MIESYLDKLETEGVPLTETVEQLIRLKIAMLEDILAEYEYLKTSDFAELPRKRQHNVLSEAKQTIDNITVNEREMTSMLVKMFHHVYRSTMERLYYV